VKKILLLTAAALLIVGASGTPMSAQTPQTPPAAKPADAPTSVAGKWNLSIDTGQGSMESVLDVKLDGKKVTGTLTGQQGETAITGEFADNKLTFTMNYDTPNGSIVVSFACTLKDNVITGTADAGQMGSFPIRAERAKDK
jgi:hypothetical protein